MIVNFTRNPITFKSFAGAIVVIILCCGPCVLAQDRCGTVEYSEKLTQRRDVLENTRQFEEWLRRGMRRKQQQGGQQRPQASTYQIPVVVHVIHNGEAVGTGTNISNAQILSQISVLNKDYQRLNTDAANTPAEFAAMAGSFDLEFVLAKQNPEGLATTGIVRVQGSKTSWTMSDNYLLKSQSYWPAEDYLNLWVCNITDYLGYAQFPVSNLPGLENSSNNRLSDGVVIAYSVFGSDDDGSFNLDPQYNKGRTATHEIGHFFGLRHIWGDDGNACGNDGDYVNDTPDQAGRTFNCPVHPATSCTSINKMFQNYMDYTDDRCMNLFTQQQVDRMTTVLENSPRRLSLLTSHGLEEPIPAANDTGIKAVLSPQATSCTAVVTPSIEIKNYGNNNITSVQVRLIVNGSVKETKTVAVNLDELEAAVVNFTPLPIGAGVFTYRFVILQTNGVADGNDANDEQIVQTTAPGAITLPFTEPFDNLPTGWTIADPDGFISWSVVNAPDASTTNEAMYMDFYDYEDGEGEIDILTTPVMDLSAVPLAVLYFDVAYAPFSSGKDGLKVYVLADCNQNIYEGTLIYDKSGNTLATTTASSAAFVPQAAADWRKEAINLSAFIGQAHVQLAFVGVNGWGNNLYLDDIAVLTSQFEDVALNSVTPNLITCQQAPTLKITTSNAGTLTINTLDVRITAEGKSPQTQTFTGLSLAAGESTALTLNPYTLSNGVNALTVEVLNPNGNIDVNAEDNLMVVNLVLNTSAFTIPYRESFETAFNDEWTLASPTGGMLWQTKTTPHFGTSVFYNAFDNDQTGEEAWLISPVFDFSEATEASLQFYSAYAVNDTHEDRLRVLYSNDCGNTFNAVPYFDKKGTSLSTIASTAAWTPQTIADWQHRVIDLSNLAGDDQLRFAFVATNDHGNNIYVDNINFSTTIDPNPLLNEQLYVISQKDDGFDFHFTFNLPEKQTVQYEVMDATGRPVVRSAIDDVLNQTYPVDLGAQAAEGIYIVRLGIGAKYYATKIFLAR